MNIDFERHLGAVERRVTSEERGGRPVRTVTLARSYDTGIDDLWDAVTNPERLPRWFAPVTGDLQPGGRYQVQGNAGGAITECAPPASFALTWEFAGDTSWVEVRLAAEGPARTRLTLTHIAHPGDHWAQYGPGATGVGWELGFLGLALHLVTPEQKVDEAAFAASPGGRAFIGGSAAAWGEAGIVGGEQAAAARAAAERTRAFYTGDAPPEA